MRITNQKQNRDLPDRQLETVKAPGVVETICTKCGKLFASLRWESAGISLSLQACPACLHEHQAGQQMAQIKEREAKARRLVASHEHRWNTTCPKEFRLPSEDGGNTDLARLEYEQPGLK